MALNVNEMRERRNYVAKQARELLNGSAEKEWTADLQSKYDTHIAEIDGIDARIANVQKIADRDAEKAFEDMGGREVQNVDARQVFNTWARRGVEGMNAEQLAQFRNTMSTTTSSEGGATVPTIVSQQLIASMKAYGAMRAVSTVLATSDGKPLSFPTSDGTSETGEWIAQNVTATGADPTFGTVSLNVFKASSKIVAAPIELLQDSAINIEAFIVQRLAQRLGRVANTGYTTGGGSTVPDGVVPRSSAGKVGTTGQTATIIFEDIIDLIHSVDPAYRSNRCVFMASDALVKVIRKLKDGDGNYLWQMGNVIQGQPGSLLGYRYYVNQAMDSIAAAKKVVLFGDLGKYMVRKVGSPITFVARERFAPDYGILGLIRFDGETANTGAIKHLITAAS
jgi:HK97 family phage major capsid protein